MAKSQIQVRPRKSPTQQRSNDTVNVILDAAAHILKQNGYEHVSTNRIAEKAGVSIGSLYQYFPNKESILTALYERHEMEIIEILRLKLSDSLSQPLPQLVGELINAMIETHRVDPKLHHVLHEEIPHLSSKMALEKVAVDLVAECLEKRNAELHLGKKTEMAAFVIVHAVEAITHKAVTNRPDFIRNREITEELTKLIVNYLG